MKKLFLALLLLPALLQAQDFSHRYFHYNQYYDAAVPFTITANTADGADTNAISISGGGTCDITRGACVTAYGNEHGYLGQLWLAAANAGASSQINFYTRGSQIWTMPGAATATASDLVFGLSSVASSVATIKGARADGSDDGILNLCAGGATGAARGGFIELDGNEIGSSQDGRVAINAGDDAVAGYIAFNTGNGFRQWTVPYQAANTANDLVFGASTVANSIATIHGARADASDDGQISICSGGACANTRGAYMTLYGAEHATGGGNVLFDLGTNGYKYEFGGGAAATAYYFLQGNNTNLVLGPSNPTAPIYVLRAQTSDADDDAELNIASGGAYGTTRGGGIALKGNEAASGAGSVRIMAGSVGTGIIYFNTTNADRWVINPTSGDLSNDLTNGGNLVFNKTTTGALIGSGALDADETGVTGSGPGLYIRRNNATVGNAVFTATDANAYGNYIYGLKTRSAAGDANTIVADGDGIFNIAAYAADGTSYRAAARIRMAVDGAPGASDMPGRIEFSTTPDGTATIANRWMVTGSAAKTSVLYAKDSTNDDLTAEVSVSSQNGDGHDEGLLSLNGGGAYGYTRGASIALQGNEYATGGGDLYVTAGNNGGSVWLRTSGTDEMVLLGASSVTVDRGAYLQVRATTEELTIAAGEGAAGKVTVGNICVSGLILGVSVRVTQAPGGGAATFNVGCTGSGNLDQFISGLSTALSTTGIYPTNGDGSNTVGWAQKTATTMTVTTNANVTGASMKVRIVVYYLTPSALSS